MSTLIIDHDTYTLLANEQEGFTEVINVSGERKPTLGVKNVSASLQEDTNEYYTQMVVYSHQRDKFYQMNFVTNNLSFTILDEQTENNCYKVEEVVLVKREEYKFVGKSEVLKGDEVVV